VISADHFRTVCGSIRRVASEDKLACASLATYPQPLTADMVPTLIIVT
jgi:hypothetical protein